MSARPSVLPPHAPRQSMYPSAAGGMTSGAQARLAAKQAELEGLKALKEHSARMAREMEKLGDKVDTLVDGGDAVASVLSSWQGVFRAIQIARASTAFMSPLQYHNTEEDADPDQSKEQEQDEEEEEERAPKQAKPVLLDTLVRIPVDLDGSVQASRDAQDPAA